MEPSAKSAFQIAIGFAVAPASCAARAATARAAAERADGAARRVKTRARPARKPDILSLMIYPS